MVWIGIEVLWCRYVETTSETGKLKRRLVDLGVRRGRAQPGSGYRVYGLDWD